MRRPLLDTHRLNPTLSAPHAPCLDHGVKPLDAPIDLPKQNHALILHGVQEAVEQARRSGKLRVIGGGIETVLQQMGVYFDRRAKLPRIGFKTDESLALPSLIRAR